MTAATISRSRSRLWMTSRMLVPRSQDILVLEKNVLSVITTPFGSRAASGPPEASCFAPPPHDGFALIEDRILVSREAALLYAPSD